MSVHLPGCGPPRMYFWMVRLLTLMPSLSSSPRIRSAPQSRPRRAMSRMSSTVSAGSGEPLRGRDLQRQKRRNPARCQRRMVSGWTSAMAPRQEGRSVAPMTSFNRSIGPSAGLFTCRLRTLSWWRSTAFSTTSSCRGRHASAASPASSLPELRRSSLDQSDLDCRPWQQLAW